MEALTDSKGTLHAKTNVRASGRTTFFDYSFKSIFSAGVNMTDWHNMTGPISIPLGERGRVT